MKTEVYKIKDQFWIICGQLPKRPSRLGTMSMPIYGKPESKIQSQSHHHCMPSLPGFGLDA
jgi:hypothetical protein